MSKRKLTRQRCDAKVYTVGGISDTLLGWCRRLGRTQSCVYKRLHHVLAGEWTEDRFFNSETQHRIGEQYEFDGFSGGSAEWAKRIGITQELFCERAKTYREGKIGYADIFRPKKVGILRYNAKTFTHNGITDTETGWAARLGICLRSFNKRIKQFRAGKITKDMVYRPFEQEKYNIDHIEYDGKTYTRTGLAKVLGISAPTLKGRIRSAKVDPSKSYLIFRKGKVTIQERQESAVATRLRRRRIRELRQMGVMV